MPLAIVQAYQEPEPLPEAGRSVGLDVGLKSFVVDTDGNSIENPRFAEKAAAKVKNIQRRLWRAEKGSNNRRKLKDKLDKVHERINNQRSDFLHKLSRYYVNNYDIICVEDLDVKGLKEKGYNKGTHRNIHDASWPKFLFMLFSRIPSRGAADGVICTYKAESAGRKLIKVDPRNTTQRCSACGSIVKKELSDRVHECPYCGFSCDRDYNSSRNILSARCCDCVAAAIDVVVADGTARSAHRVKTATSQICDASFGDEVGSRALKGTVVH